MNPPGVILALFASLLASPSACTPAATAGAVVAGQAAPARLPPYWNEKGLEKRVSLGGPARPPPDLTATGHSSGGSKHTRPVHLVGQLLYGMQLVEMLQKTTGVDVRLQGDWMRELIAASGNPEARELMRDLKTVFGGEWLLIGKTWILARSRVEAQLTMMSDADRQAARQQMGKELFASLRPDQVERLKRDGKTDFSLLTPDQQRSAVGTIQFSYYDPGLPLATGIDGGALTGRGVYLGYLPNGFDGGPGIYLSAPPPQGMDIPPFTAASLTL